MNKAIIAIMVLMLVPFALAVTNATADVTVNITEPEETPIVIAPVADTSFESLIKQKIVAPKPNTCYFYTDATILAGDSATGTEFNQNGPVVKDVTNYETLTFYPVHDQDTLVRFVKTHCYETIPTIIGNAPIIVFKDSGTNCCSSDKTFLLILASPS